MPLPLHVHTPLQATHTMLAIFRDGYNQGLNGLLPT
jgi:hypothetical protein